jgi:hypothetical protein
MDDEGLCEAVAAIGLKSQINFRVFAYLSLQVW